MPPAKDIEASMQDLNLTLGHLQPLLARLLSMTQTAGDSSSQKLDDLTQSLNAVVCSLERMATRQQQIQSEMADLAKTEAALTGRMTAMGKRFSEGAAQMDRLESLLTELIRLLQDPT